VGPIFDGYGAKLMLLVGSVDRKEAIDTREELNPSEIEEFV
jgi:hypothetical protein